MYTKEDILKKLNLENYYIDMNALCTFIKEWQLDAIYENNEGVEYYDDGSILKIKRGISLKSQGYDSEEIAFKLQKMNQEMKTTEVKNELRQTFEYAEEEPSSKTPALNVTNQTLQILAEAVAEKVGSEIKEKMGTIDFANTLLEAGAYKKDNEILAKQVETLKEDNKLLAQRIANLEKKKGFFAKLFG